MHTILLGVIKYLWGQSVFVMDKRKTFDLFATRLRSVEVSGLHTGSIPNYILTNRGSLIGKHFKILGQTAIFCLYGLVSEELQNCWLAVGRLMVLAWYSIIRDIDAYIVGSFLILNMFLMSSKAELQVSIDDFLHTLAKCAPRLIADKSKTHLLVHMPLFVRRHGPLLGSNTERYESFNSTFRQCSILGNGQAPSRDIARTFKAFDRTKHIAAGGYYFDTTPKRFVQGGSSVLEMGRHNSFISRIFGFEAHIKPCMPGGYFSIGDY